MYHDVAYKPLQPVKPIYAGGTLTSPKFMPSFYEWLSSKGVQIIANISNIATTGQVIYTVPENSTLFIHSAWLQTRASSDAAGIYEGSMFLTQDGSSTSILKQIFRYNDVAKSKTNTMGFNIPLKIFQGGKIGIDASDKVISAGGIIGFLVKNQDIPFF